jgi:hypothetical protein
MPKDFNFQEFSYTLPPNRQILAAKLIENKWFQNTDSDLQQEILTLPNDYEGFLYNLSLRPDIIGHLEVLKLLKVIRGEFLVTPVFEVHSSTSGKTFTKEYVIWKMGSFPGIKGTLFVQAAGAITHFVTIQTDKFPVGDLCYDSIGGLFQYVKGTTIDLPNKVEHLIKEKLGLTELNIKQFIDLGHIQSDNGLTPNYPQIFAAVIDGDEARHLSAREIDPQDREQSNFQIQIVPIQELSEYLGKVDDAFFLAIVARLLAKKIISL